MNHSIFKDDTLSELFDKEGYVKVPFLDDAGLAIFRQHSRSHLENFVGSSYGTTSTTDLNHPLIVREVHEFISSNISIYLEPYFKDCKAILGNYLIKKPVENSLIPVHQDWTFVDEQKFYSLSIWCPLGDVSPQNGNLQVVPRTHKMSSNLRPSPNYPDAFDSISSLVRKQLIDIPMKAGEAIFYNHALLHASPVNRSGNPRSVLIYGLTHKDAALLHYYNPNDKIYFDTEVMLDLYEMNEEFFYNHIRGERPSKLFYDKRIFHTMRPVSKQRFMQDFEKSTLFDRLINSFLSTIGLVKESYK
jgi:hypothetical protein